MTRIGLALVLAEPVLIALGALTCLISLNGSAVREYDEVCAAAAIS